MSFEKVCKNLEKNGFRVKCFKNKEEVSNYLEENIKNTSVGMGGSVSINELNLYEKLSKNNEVWWHSRIPENMKIKEVFEKASRTDIYISSVNGLAETGELIEIDNTGNRVASIMYGHNLVYLIIGKNKLAENYDKALFRARNIAATRNARRLKCKTPCAPNEDTCYDCNSPDRICRALLVLMKKPMGSDYEILLVDENLGY